MADAATRLAEFLSQERDGRIKCKVCDTVPGETLGVVETAFAEGANVAVLSRFLSAENISVSYSVLARHLTGHK